MSFRARCLEPADVFDFHRTMGPGRNRSFETLQCPASLSVFRLEGTAEQASRRFRQPRWYRVRQAPAAATPDLVCRRPRRARCASPSPIKFADHDEAGGDADPHRQRDAPARRSNSPRASINVEAGAGGALGIVLMGARIAEIDRGRRVQAIWRQWPSRARDSGRDHRSLECADQIAHVFRIEQRRQRRGVDEVAEHHGELAPVSRVLRLGFCGLPFRGWREGSSTGAQAEHRDP